MSTPIQKTLTPVLPLECEEVPPETLGDEALKKIDDYKNSAWLVTFDDEGEKSVFKLNIDAVPGDVELFITSATSENVTRSSASSRKLRCPPNPRDCCKYFPPRPPLPPGWYCCNNPTVRCRKNRS